MAQPPEEETGRWLTPGVGSLGTASLLSDLGHEVPSALLPSLLTSTLGAPAAALGVIEGVSDGLAGVARLAGGALADDPGRRRAITVGGYTTTAVLSSAIGAAHAVWQVGVLRAGAWTARGLRGPARNALLADMVPRAAYGRAFGFERAMDNLGAIGGPLLALGLVAAVGVRWAILLSVVPGLLAAAAIWYAARAVPRPARHERVPVRLRLAPVLRGRLGRLVGAAAAFEVGNVAATLLLLRATELLTPRYGATAAVTLGLLLYAGYNTAAAVASIFAGRAADRRGAVAVLTVGVALFGLAYGLFAVAPGAGPGGAAAAAATAVLVVPAVAFAAAGVAIGCVETAEHAAVAALAPVEVRGSAFGVLAAIQAGGNLAASAVAGVLWSAVSPEAAFTYLAGWMVLALLALAGLLSRSGQRDNS